MIAINSRTMHRGDISDVLCCMNMIDVHTNTTERDLQWTITGLMLMNIK